ncbi:MAG: hypothetical protein AABY86_15250, partial [Bdellovibrionota bacterium]
MQKYKIPLNYYLHKQTPYRLSVEDYLGPRMASPANHQSEYNRKDYDLGLHNDKPIVPFIPHAFDMEFDLVLGLQAGLQDGPWTMLEIVRVDIDGTKVWFTLDSKFDGTQYVGLPKDEGQRQLVQGICKSMGIESYEANLVVLAVGEVDEVDENDLSLLVKYTRKNRLLDFKVELPKGKTYENVIDERKRLSHGMNHSESKFLAVIDIYKNLGPLDMANLKVVFNKSSDDEDAIKFDKILGFKVKTILSQMVTTIGEMKIDFSKMPGLWTRIEESATSEMWEYTYHVRANNRDYILQRVQFLFEKHNGHLELRKITNLSVSKMKDNKLASWHFNPALPDLRFGLAPEALVSRAILEVKGLPDADALRAVLGEVIVQKNKNEKLIYLRNGQSGFSDNQRFLKTPEWLHARPYLGILKTSLSGRPVLEGSIMANSDQLASSSE